MRPATRIAGANLLHFEAAVRQTCAKRRESVHPERRRCDPAHMNQIASLPAAAGQNHVTSSDLVRRFGEWQERAARAPVYIIHRGRPRLVLVSVEIMDALCTPHAGTGDREADAHALADTIVDPLLILGADGRIAHANAAALARFGASARAGAWPAQLSRASGGFLADTIERVLASGLTETVEVVPDRFADRRAAVRITALPSGALCRIEEASAREEQVASDAARGALVDAIAASGVAAVARVGPRGIVLSPDAALARLTGTTAEQLAAARFVSLFDVGDRVRTGEAIEALFAGGAPRRLDARLLVRGAQPLTVAVGLSAVRVAGRVEEVTAAIVPAP